MELRKKNTERRRNQTQKKRNERKSQETRPGQNFVDGWTVFG